MGKGKYPTRNKNYVIINLVRRGIMSNLIKLEELDMGMILAEDVVDTETGVVLIGKNMGVSKELINKLENHKISHIKIKEENIPEEYINQGLMDSYKSLKDELELVFKSIGNQEEVSQDQIRYMLKSFIEETYKEKDILTQMRLMKTRTYNLLTHSLGVSILSISLGKWLGYSKEEIVDLGIAGLFHDIGKLFISDHLMEKQGGLTKEEKIIMRKHPFKASEVLMKSGFNHDIIMGVLQHHEKMDGSGYPNGVSGDRIHKYARVIALANNYHYLTSRKIYHDKGSPLSVADYIRSLGFSSLDPEISQVFLRNISTFYVGNKVVLNTGEIGTIIYLHPQDKTRPIVKIGDEYIDFSIEKNRVIEDIII